MDIPQFMPMLGRGPHKSPSDGACVMEYISFIAGERWTDLPSCTNMLLALTAQRVNDFLDTDRRQELIPLMSRLMGTGINSDAANRAIAEAAVTEAESLIGQPFYNGYAENAIDALANDEFDRATRNATFGTNLSGRDPVAFLSALIDSYDKAVGRTAPATVTEDDLRRCAELTGASR